MRAPKFTVPVTLFVLSISFLTLLALNGCGDTNESFATWNQGTSAQWLIPVAQGFCYMTRISGDFNSDKEEVYVGVFPFPNSAATPTWQVGGTSGSKDVTVTAGCSAFSSFNMKNYSVQDPPWVSAAPVYVPPVPATPLPPYPDCCSIGFPLCSVSTICGYTGGSNGAWQAGSVTTGLLNTNSFCSLNAIRGGFNGGEGVAVQPIPSTSLDLFQLGVAAPTPNDTVSAAASCVSFSPLALSGFRLTKIYTWTQAQNQPVDMIPGSAGVCFLMSVGGKFRGNGEYVEIEHDTANPRSSTPQRLTGHSDQKNVSAQAMCVLYSPSTAPPPWWQQ